MEISSISIPLPVYALDRDQFTPGECARILLGQNCETGRNCLPAAVLKPPSSAYVPLSSQNPSFSPLLPSSLSLCVSPLSHAHPMHSHACTHTHTHSLPPPPPSHFLGSDGGTLWFSHQMTPSALKLSPVPCSLPLHQTNPLSSSPLGLAKWLKLI